MTPEQLVYFLKGFIVGREPGPLNDDEWSMIQAEILRSGGTLSPCGCGGKSHG